MFLIKELGREERRQSEQEGDHFMWLRRAGGKKQFFPLFEKSTERHCELYVRHQIITLSAHRIFLPPFRYLV